MELSVLLEALVDAGESGLASSEAQQQVRQVLAQLPASAPADWRHLAAAQAVSILSATDAPFVLGIGGGQGAGKSTLAAQIVRAAEALDRRAICVSLDDFYLTRSQRQRLGEDVHPLLATRGVPGTHDLALALATLNGLLSAGEVDVPIFDKSVDDRNPAGRTVSGPFDLVVFEGWCVGVAAEPDGRLPEPINALEREEDRQGVWRSYVNQTLTDDYPELWRTLHRLLFLQVPDLAAVVRWRTEQEQAHPPSRRMTAAAIERFVAHYERLTRWMAESMADQADFLAILDDAHRLAGLARGAGRHHGNIP